MSHAFSSVRNAKWNEEVARYLATRFNTVNPRFIVLSESVFINATLAKFDGVSFVINAAYECLELSFAKTDSDKLESVIQALVSWEDFSKHATSFYVKVDKDTSRSVLFASGVHQTVTEYKKYFSKYNIEIIK